MHESINSIKETCLVHLCTLGSSWPTQQMTIRVLQNILILPPASTLASASNILVAKLSTT